MLAAIDGQINGGEDTDKFRIKIWDKISGIIIYDNGVGSDIQNGSIVFHKEKN